MSKSNAQQYQTIDAADDEQIAPRAHDIAMSPAGRAIREFIVREDCEDHELSDRDVEVYQFRRLVYEDTARACAKEVQN